MNRVGAVLVMAVAVLLQVSLLPALRPLGVVPDLALVAMVLVALNVATSRALVLAVAGGIILDLASGANFGLWTGVFMIVSLVCGMLHRVGIELDRMAVALVLVLSATLVMAAVIWIGLASKVTHWPVLSFGGRLGLELMINLVLTMMLARPVRILLGTERAKHAGGR